VTLVRRLPRILAGLLLVGCGADPDSIVVVKVTAGPNLPAVVQLRGTFSNAGAGTERIFPTKGGITPIAFPTSFSVTVPRARQGALDVALDGLDPQGAAVASASTRVVIARGATAEVEVLLVQGAAPCGNGRPDTGESCDDGNRVSGDGCSFLCEKEEGAPAAPDGGADARAPSDGATGAPDGPGSDLGAADARADLAPDAPGVTPDVGACVPGTRQACYTGPAGTMGNAPCHPGMTFCNDKSAWEPCDGEVKPRPETCNGIDDDCSGVADDGLGGMQTCGVGECQVMVASCANGRPPTCSPRAPGMEICNGKDDDCNGTPDDGMVTCGIGSCARTVPRCTAGQPTACTPGAATAEICNGKDDDCNGTPDDGTQTCGVGGCQRTVARCSNGLPVTCAPGTPQAETCNARDDDCNGLIDDGAAQVWPACSHQSGYSCMQFGPGDADCCIGGVTEQDCLAGLYTWRNGVCCE
jgi:cysteine-rich repeat protein